MVVGALALGIAVLAAWEIWVLRLADLRDPRAARVITVPTPQGTRTLTIGPQSPYWTPIATVSRTLVVCVVRAEDAKPRSMRPSGAPPRSSRAPGQRV